MCGRFTLTVHQIEALADHLAAQLVLPEGMAYRPRYNVAPGETHWLLRPRREPTPERPREIVAARWGLINHWAKDHRIGYRQINARAETVDTRRAYRDAFARRRCAALADGFYEWRGPKGKREPIWFHAEDRRPLYLAGLFESWTAPDTEARVRSFTVITTEANAVVAPVHDRMPVILGEDELNQWLHGPPDKGLLAPAPDDLLVAAPASPRVNKAGNDDPALLDPDDPAVVKQGVLF